MPEPSIWDLVIADMRARDEKGTAKYGVALRAHDGRRTLQDAYEEALDLAVYLKKAIIERGAAPDLLAALKTLIYAHPVLRSHPIGSEGSRARIAQEDAMRAEDEALAAISKATGDANV